MPDRLVYTTLCQLPGASAGQVAPLVEMAEMWAAHLRGPGRFDGRVVLLTNVPGLHVAGAEAIPVPFAAADRRHLFLERVRRFRAVPVAERIMQLDQDAVAVGPLDELFDAVRPGMLSAARSGSSPLIHDHAGRLLTRRQRWAYRLRGWDRRAGVSACATVCRGDDFRPLMRRWAAAFRGRPVGPLGDQGFLNWLYLTGAMPVRRLPGRLVHHVRHPGGPAVPPAGAAVVHFPWAGKLAEMRRWRSA